MPVKLSAPVCRIRLVINVPNCGGVTSGDAMVRKQSRPQSDCTQPASFDCGQSWSGEKDGLKNLDSLIWKSYAENVNSQGTLVHLNAFAQRFGAPVCTWTLDRLSSATGTLIGPDVVLTCDHVGDEVGGNDDPLVGRWTFQYEWASPNEKCQPKVWAPGASYGRQTLDVRISILRPRAQCLNDDQTPATLPGEAYAWGHHRLRCWRPAKNQRLAMIGHPKRTAKRVYELSVDSPY